MHDLATLEAFARAVVRETHNVSQRPELLWQQLLNRLQWDGDQVAAVLRGELQRRTSSGVRPWVRTRTYLGESQALVRVLRGHTHGVSACAISPDGSLIVSASREEPLRVWDVSTGRERGIFGGDDDWMSACAFGADGSAIVGAGGTVEVRDVQTGTERIRFRGHAGSCSDCAVVSDGSFVVSASNDRTLKLWDPATGAEHAVLRGHTGPVSACAVSPDGSFIVSGGKDGSLKIWQVSRGRWQRRLRVKERVSLRDPIDWVDYTHEITACRISPDGSYIVSASRDYDLTVWDTQTGDERMTLRGHTAPVTACAVSPDGSFIVSASADKTLRVWNAQTGDQRATLQGHTDSVTACEVSPNGSLIVSGSWDDTLRIWDAQRVEESAPRARHTWKVTSCTFSPDGSLLASSGGEGALELWDVRTGEKQSTFVAPHERRDLLARGPEARSYMAVSDCAFSPDGSFVVCASLDNELHIYDPVTKRERAALVGHESGVLACAVSPDGSFVASASEDKTLKLWPSEGGKKRADEEEWIWLERDSTTLEGHTRAVKACAVSPDGSYVVSGSDDGTVKLWHTDTGEERATLRGHTDEVTACAVSPDGSFIVSASFDKTLKLWDPETHEERDTIRAHGGIVYGCAVSPDGSVLISVGKDEMLRVWSLPTAKGLAEIPLLGGGTALALHPSVPVAACGDEGGNVYLLDLVGVEYGPLVVTPVPRGAGITVRCPACFREHAVDRRRLGSIIDCDTSACGGQLRVNPFVTKLPPWAEG